MRNILSIAGREIKSSFSSPLAYVLIASFLLLAGVFFFLLLKDFNGLVIQAAMIPDFHPNLNELVVMPFYQTLQIVLIFLIPIITMRAIAEEKRSGTFELLATSPLSVNEIVLGKFLGIFGVVFVMLLLSFIYPLVLMIFTDPEVLPVFVGFFGMLLLAASLVALGIAVSACTQSQMVAGVISLVLFLVFFIVDAPADFFGGSIAHVLKYLSPSLHAETLLKGVIDGVDLVYFFSVVLVGLFLTGRILEAQRWR